MSAAPPPVFHATRMQDLAALTDFVEQACRQAGADDAFFPVRLAVEEVFSNIMHHGYKGAAGPVSIVVDAQPHRVVVTLADAAPRFDPAAAPLLPQNAPWQERVPGGVGWHLVRHVMDQVQWRPGVEHGNVFTLVKSLPGPASRLPGEQLREN